MTKFLKRSAIAFIALCMLLFAVGANAAMKDGTYNGKANGINGEINVEVLVKSGKIADVKIVNHTETAGLGGVAMEKLRTEMIEGNSSNIDTISGATKSSKGFIAAVQMALTAAGATKADLAQKSTLKVQGLNASYDFDVVIIGSGGAGLSAAVEASRTGAKVVVIEKNDIPGGSTTISGADLNAAGTDIQKELGIEDHTEWHIEDTLKGGDNLGDPKLVGILAKNAPAAVKWLESDIGTKLIHTSLFQFGGNRVPRAVSQATGYGDAIVAKLEQAAEKSGTTFFFSTKATAIVRDKSGVVTGVKAVNNGKEVTFNAKKAVIVATGGFASSVEMRKKYNKNYDERYMSTSAPGSLGEGIIMAEAIGANLVGMEYIQLHPACNPKTGAMSYIAAGAYIDGGILVNQQGKRFVNELERRDVVSEAIINQTGNVAYVVWNQEVMGKSVEFFPQEYGALLMDNLIHKADDYKGLADFFKMDAKQLEQTMNTWNGYTEKKVDPDFHQNGKMTSLKKGPFYIQKITPAAHYTMGGIQINEKTEVVDKNGKVIQYLFAAGEVTGGVHGSNRLGGNAMADIIVFGRIAGQNATK